VEVVGPAVPELVAAVVLAEHGIGPPPQLGQPRGVGVTVQADPVRGGRPAGGGGVERAATVWASSSNRAARFRLARSPAWSSRALMARTWPRRAARVQRAGPWS
jgi:hypothetical protein